MWMTAPNGKGDILEMGWVACTPDLSASPTNMLEAICSDKAIVSDQTHPKDCIKVILNDNPIGIVNGFRECNRGS